MSTAPILKHIGFLDGGQWEVDGNLQFSKSKIFDLFNFSADFSDKEFKHSNTEKKRKEEKIRI